MSASGGAQQALTLEFRAVAGDAPLTCGRPYPGVGAGDATVSLQDARLYVLNSPTGREVPPTRFRDGL